MSKFTQSLMSAYELFQKTVHVNIVHVKNSVSEVSARRNYNKGELVLIPLAAKVTIGNEIPSNGVPVPVLEGLPPYQPSPQPNLVFCQMQGRVQRRPIKR
eukprot:1784114-Pyramimonas_sp.AAC.1